MTERQLSVAIVGADHHNKDGGNRRSEIAFLNPGEPLELRPEPKHPNDEHAIGVFTARGFQIGYVKSERAVFLAGLMRAGRELTTIFQDVANWGAIARIGVDCPPVLPPSPEISEEEERENSPDDDIGFYPDDEPDYG